MTRGGAGNARAHDAILPGSTLGVLGSGQLGRMFAIAARQMGYRVHTFSPDDDTPTGQVADVEISARYDDLDAVRAFAKNVDVVTFEFENVSAEAAAAAEECAPVRPSGRVLHVTQHRKREKMFLRDAGFPIAPFETVSSLEQLKSAAARVGLPGVLKTAGWGYDGKGQAKIGGEEDIDEAWAAIARHQANGNGAAPEAVLEKFIDFEREVSVVAARGLDGEIVQYPVIENAHARHILDVSTCPADVPARVAKEAAEIACGVLEALDVVGVLCVEFFLTRDWRLLINELAPRPHNSGHLTIDACATSQFEQQVRAICGLPLGSADLLRPAAMANLLGDLWKNGEPDWGAALALENVKLHLYGKAAPREGRKMGHLTALAETAEGAKRKAVAAREALSRVKRDAHVEAAP